MENKLRSLCYLDESAKRWLIGYQALFGATALLGAGAVPFLYNQFPRIKDGFSDYLGNLKPLIGKETIWLHGVSMGESMVANGFARELKKRRGNVKIGFTSTHPDVLTIVRKKKLADASGYFPLDNLMCMNKAFKRWHPSAVFVAETDFWPVFSHLCSKKHIPLVLINGRISTKIVSFYSRFPGLAELVFGAFHTMLVQGQSDYDKLVEIGVRKSKIIICGNMKTDLTPLSYQSNFTKIKKWASSNKIVIFGSLHPNEFELLQDNFNELVQKQIKIIIAPRNVLNCQKWKTQLTNSGNKVVLKSNKQYELDSNIMLVDTMGELAAMYSLANAAFVGGSLENTIGGHNPIEVIQSKTPLLIGNSTINFADIMHQLSSSEGALICKNSEDLSENLNKVINNATYSDKLVTNASNVLEKNRGALKITMDIAEKILLNKSNNLE